MSTFFLVVEYDGSAFSGWQKQPGCHTVQSEIESAATAVTGFPAKATAAGRTDKGVHATGQAVSLQVSSTLPAQKLFIALNAVLPKDIAVVRARKISDTFNARYAARHKTYCYRILNRPGRSVWQGNGSWHVIKPLNLASMRSAAKPLIGKHDFSAFEVAGSTMKNKIVNMRRIAIARKGDMVTCTFTADRFLYKMVRSMVGTLVEVGQGDRSAASLSDILKSRNRRFAGMTAPGNGLFLAHVGY